MPIRRIWRWLLCSWLGHLMVSVWPADDPPPRDKGFVCCWWCGYSARVLKTIIAPRADDGENK